MKLLFSLFAILFFTNTYSQKYIMLIGTYDSPKSEGIYVYDFNTVDGTTILLSKIKTSNPSFLAVSKNNKFVYAVNENANKNGNGGSVSSFSFNNKNNTLSFLNKQSTMGNHPCHVSIDKKEKWLSISNYSTGNLCILPLQKNGTIDSVIQIKQHEGKGYDTVRQQSSHVHSSYFSEQNNYLITSDLGLDKIYFYSFNDKKGIISNTKINYKSISNGSGPRHIAFSKNEQYIYALQELSGKIIVFKNKGSLDVQQLQEISTLPPKFAGAAGSADIHISPDGNFLYASNRGESNTIAIFSINKIDGKLSLVGHQNTLGIAPRNFNFDPTGNFLIVANQNSNEIVIFKRDVLTGLLKDTGNRIAVGKPVCIQWILKD
jgi:6-phosphogluconolactonase